MTEERSAARRRDPLTVERLRMLAEVARTGTIAGAARALGLTASAVSQQLSSMEREADVALLDRAGRQAALTVAGRALVDHASRVAGALEAAAADLDRLRGAVGGRFRIAAVTSASLSFVSRAVEELREQHPELEVLVDDEEPARSLDRLARGDVDLAVVDEYDHAPHPLPDGLVTSELLVEPLLVVTPAGWSPGATAVVGARRRSTPASTPTAAKRRGREASVALADLEKERWVLAPDTAACGEAVRTACRALGFEPDVRWRTDDIYAHLAHVAAGHGVTVLPSLAVQTALADVDVHLLTDPPLNRRLLAATRSATVERPAITAVLQALHAAATP